MSVDVVIVAGGSSKRYGGDVPKQFQEICGKSMLAWTIGKFQEADSIDNILVVAPEEYLVYVSEKIIDPNEFDKVNKIVAGGSSRQESVYNGLMALPKSVEFVAIHDGARPLVKTEDINKVVSTAKAKKSAILAIPVADTIKKVKNRSIISTVNREQLYCAQTPQVFQYEIIMDAHKKMSIINDESITDDAQLVESSGQKVAIVEPTGINLKITTRQDMIIAEAILEKGINE